MTTQEKSKRELVMEFREQRSRKKQELLQRKKKIRVAALVTLAAVMVTIFGAVYNAFAIDVTITEINEFTGLNESQTIRTTRGGNVEELLKERGIDIGEDDRLNVPADKEISDNDDIVLTRGKRVTIKVGDQENEATITKADAAEALVEAGYIPGAYDDIKAEGDTIELVSVSHMDETVRETIERGVEYVDDADLPAGKEVVLDEGEDGVKEIQQKVTYLNGEESERQPLGETITVNMRNKIIARGTAVATEPPKSAQSASVTDDGGTVNGYKYKRKITMTATAYSTDPSENAGYTVSAMGNPLGYGIVAVDPSVVPLGSTVYVTSPDGSWNYGVASAEDTGGAIKGNRIDLCFPYNNDAFGRRSCVVYVLE